MFTKDCCWKSLQVDKHRHWELCPFLLCTDQLFREKWRLSLLSVYIDTVLYTFPKARKLRTWDFAKEKPKFDPQYYYI